MRFFVTVRGVAKAEVWRIIPERSQFVSAAHQSQVQQHVPHPPHPSQMAPPPPQQHLLGVDDGSKRPRLGVPAPHAHAHTYPLMPPAWGHYPPHH